MPPLFRSRRVPGGRVALLASSVLLALLITAASSRAQDTAEISTEEQAATFSTGVNLVNVPVVVRDRNQKYVGDLKKEDFLVFDNGKPQVITRFSVQKRNGPQAAAPKPDSSSSDELNTDAAAHKPEIADRFVAFVFDDMNLDMGDLLYVRKRLDAFLSAPARDPNVRIGLFTTSGQNMLDFTSDLNALRNTLNAIMPRSRAASRTQSCPPPVSYYAADQIINRDNTGALQAIAAEVLVCECPPGAPCPISPTQAQSEARSLAHQARSLGETEIRTAIGVLRNVVRRMASVPGQRTAILISPGFLTLEVRPEITDLINAAIRQNIVFSAVDARGLYTDPSLDASRPPMPFSAQQEINALDRDDQLASGDVLGEIADGTGGTWFHNNNDFGAAFRRSVEPPEAYYLISYSAGDLKTDGRFHKIKVSLKDPSGLMVQARRGYYAPSRKSDAAEQAKQDIEEALFSRDELRTIPLNLHTQFFKSAADAATLAVLAHIDLKRVHFRKAEGRNNDELTIVSGLFDRDGKYITAKQTILQLRLRDATLEARLQSGVTVKSSFDVKSGAYLVRLVVRDANGNDLATTSGSIEIP